MDTPATEDPLGPFQEIWEAWEETHDEMLRKPLSHFRRATDIQFDELEAHLAASEHEKASREAVDIISIALNLMRRLGHTPEEIAEITRARAEHRMKGQASAILDKYQRLYNI